MLTLISKDKQVFTIRKEVACQSITIGNLLKDDSASDRIPIPQVDSKTLALVIEFLNKQFAVTHSSKQEEATNDLANFFKKRELKELIDLAAASRYLCIKELIDGCCVPMGALLANKFPDESRETMKFIREVTPERLEALYEKEGWPFPSYYAK